MRRAKQKNANQEKKREHKIRVKAQQADRRSGKISKKEGKVQAADAKKRTSISQRRMATIKKSRY